MSRRPSIALETKSADLASDFGYSWAVKLFGAETVASLPARMAGKNKGKPKGFVIWRKALASGYCREVQSPLAAGAVADAWLAAGAFCTRSEPLTGLWLGRVQEIAGSGYYLFEEDRARAAADMARG